VDATDDKIRNPISVTQRDIEGVTFDARMTLGAKTKNELRRREKRNKYDMKTIEGANIST